MDLHEHQRQQNYRSKLRKEVAALALIVQGIDSARRRGAISADDEAFRLRHAAATFLSATDAHDYHCTGGWPGSPGIRITDYAEKSLGSPCLSPVPGEHEPGEWCSGCGGKWPNGGCVCPGRVRL